MTNDNPGRIPPAEGQDTAGDPVAREAVDWFVRLQASQGDPATVRTFRAWIENDPRHAAAFEKVTAVWGAPEFLLATKNIARVTGLQAPRRKTGRRSLAKKAAAVGTAVLLAYGLARSPDLLLWMQADYITATGELRTIPLPDGSTMTLNTGSAVALDFAGGRRGVKLLKGEAYFDVRTGLTPKFQVTAQFGQVDVKGTAFSVILDSNEDRVLLSRGAVDVARRLQPNDHALLAPGELVSITANALMPALRVDANRSLAWLEGRISFNDQPLGQVLNDIRRYYPGRIFVVDDAIERVAVSGSYKLDRPMLIIQSLAEAAGATVTTLPGGFIILR